MSRFLPLYLGAVLALSLSLAGVAATQPLGSIREDTDAAIAEASASTGLPFVWIEAVIRAESGGNAGAISTAGAMGLMQLMPQTWVELRSRLGLGSDPFDVRDNVMAGAHYLRQMVDRFGIAGGLAAYNSGPARYTGHLRGGPLPRETRAYVARLAPQLLGRQVAKGREQRSRRWTHSPLFSSGGGSSQ